MMFFDSTNAQMARLINLAMLKGCKDRSKGNKEFTIRMKNSKSLVPLRPPNAGKKTFKYEWIILISSRTKEPCRLKKDPDFNMTICMPRVGRNRIHLNQDYNTSRAKTRSRIIKTMTPATSQVRTDTIIQKDI